MYAPAHPQFIIFLGRQLQPFKSIVVGNATAVRPVLIEVSFA